MEMLQLFSASLLLAVILTFNCVTGQNPVAEVRLVDRGGVIQTSFGRVEVRINTTWGTVCDDLWDDLDAAVICKMKGFSEGGQAFRAAFFGQGTGPIFLDDVNCDGSETNINACSRNPAIGATDCNHAEDAGVNCTTTGAVTPNSVSTTTTSAPIIFPSNCSAGLQNPNLRLRASANAPVGMGIVEIRNSTTGQWGTICDDTFDVLDASVVCRALCYVTNDPRPGSLARYIEGGSVYPIAVDDLACVGNEAGPDSCPKSPWGQHDCSTTEKASVTCVHLNSAPKEAPIPRLDCREGYLVAAFNKSYDANLEPKYLSVADQPGCPQATTQDDPQFVTIKIPFTACGTRLTQNSSHLVYSNTIQYDHTSIEGYITRVNVFRIEVRCEMNRRKNLVKEEAPLTASATQSAPGEFVITMKFYRNDSFLVEATQTPLRIPIGEWLNVGLEMENVDSKLKLIVPTCRALPFDNGTSIDYPLFQSNCRNEPSLALFPFNQTKFGFRYQTFMFMNTPSVFIQCETFVCLASDNTAVCDRSCNSSKPQPATATTTVSTLRRRRDVTDFPPRHYRITSAPIIVYRMENTETVLERIAGDGSVLGTTIRIPVTVTEVPSTEAASTLRADGTTTQRREPTSGTKKPTTMKTMQSVSTQPSSSRSTSGTTATSTRATTPTRTLKWEWAQGITQAPTRETTAQRATTTTQPQTVILRDSGSVAADILRNPAHADSRQRQSQDSFVLVAVPASSPKLPFDFVTLFLCVLLSAVVV